jgi:hypothetical protein
MSKITLHESKDGESGVLPSAVLERLGMGPGESVYAIDRPGGVLLTTDPNFGAAIDAADEITERYKGALQRLADL